MKDFTDKAKEKMVEKVVKKKVEKSLGGEDGETDGEVYETDEGGSDTSTASTGFRAKIANKFRKLRRAPSKSSSQCSDGESVAGRASDTETPIETSDASGGETSDPEHFSTPTSQDGSSWESDGAGSSDGEGHRGKDLAFDSEMAKPVVDDLPQDKKMKFTIAVRVIDAIELQGYEGQELNPMVRIVVGNKCRKTHVIRGTDNPLWDQTVYFTIQSTLQDLSTKTIEFRVYSAGSFLRNALIGGFRYDLGLVYKGPNHKALGKWLALRSVSDDSETDGQIRGFLRVCAGITYPGYSGSASLPFNPRDCEVVEAADALCYRLQFRAYKLLSIVHQVRYANTKAPAASLLLGVEIMLGQHRVESTFHESSDENIAINEELLLPIMWPSVSRKVRIRILARKHKKSKKTVVCTAFLDMKQLCQSGENGYLPLFGPSFVNFFGPDLGKNKPSSSEQKRMKNGESECTSFYGRLLCDLDCEAAKLLRPTVRDLTMASIGGSEAYYCRRNFNLFASFFSANMINPEFKSNNVQYAISIGEFGNPDYDLVLNSSDRSLPSMPIYDSTRYYAMPWGTHKPICEIQCSWENIMPRISQSNAIFRISRLLKDFREEAEARSANQTEVGALISVVVNAIDETLCALHWIETSTAYSKQRENDEMWFTQLDYHLQESRFHKFSQIRAKLEDFKYTAVEASIMEEPGIQRLITCARELEDLSHDAELSIPDVLILMLVDREPVAFAKIPVAEITFHTNEMKAGVDCGKLKTIYLKWLKQKRHNRKLMEQTLPSVLQARFWFGLSEYRQFWENSLAPGKMKYYAELFVNEKRKLLSSSFAQTNQKPFGISDETGNIELSEQTVRPPAGWKFKGAWRQQMTHDMYVGPETGTKRFEDECFEIQKQVDEEWIPDGYTSYYGDKLDEAELQKPPTGWEYDGKWEVDLHCEGGVDGWVYSLNNEFSEKSGACDVVERIGHKYRRRRLKRFRTLKNSATLWSLYEDVEVFKKRCDEFGWEYAQKFDKPLHMQQQHGDSFRRKRMLRQIVRERHNAYKLAIRVDGKSGGYTSPRIYEVHTQISSFQLRVYILWARELICTEKVVTRTFVRVFFLHRCQETAVIKHTTNPIYNETLIFDEILVSGGILSLQKNPPCAVIEVLGETFEGVDLVLGRFELAPTVLASAEKEPPKIRWYNLSQTADNGRGALLVYAEMYQTDPTKRRLLPKLPVMKKSNRYEVPPDYRPNFVMYNVQILCWGMRNLQRFRLTKIRQPWLEVSVADITGQTLPIKDSEVSPNFDDPLMTFHDVLMPEKLYYAPPIQIALFDQRTFGMQPQVGVCTISNFTTFLKVPQPPVTTDPSQWAEYDDIATDEREQERNELAAFERDKLGNSDEFYAFPDDPNSPRIDWWCKYYYSTGEFEKAPGYGDLGLNKIKIFGKSLEDVGDYRGFGDFLDTFYLHRNSRKKRRDATRSKDICGELKGKLFIMRQNAKNAKLLLDHVPGAEFEGVVPCIVRVYVIRAYDLVSCNKNGILDPCLRIRIGSRKFTSPYVPDTTKPIFGNMFEIPVNIPKETTMKIAVLDKKRFFGGEEIGETTIDLENRLLTKHRATVGLPEMYNLFGPLPWRDQLPPMEILSRYCRKMGYPAPKVLRSKEDCGLEVFGNSVWLSVIEPRKAAAEYLLGRPIQRVALFILHSIGLVPEHVETRPLYSAINPDLEVGKLECFIDIFPKCLGTVPPSIDISPRKPQAYQLRLAIFKTRNVILMKRSFGTPAGDLYIRCYLNGASKAEKTDIHYRCLDGAGSFNYRLLFNFEYDPWERMISTKRKTRLFRKASSELVDPVLVVQICDNNKFSKDTVIGEILLPLLGFEEGQLSEDDMVNVYYHKERIYKRCCVNCCVFCWRTRCCLRPEKTKKLRLPKAPVYIPDKLRIASLFQQKCVRGWWPALSTRVPKEQRGDYTSEKKKDDDFDPDTKYVTGMLEMELSLVTSAQAIAEPVGKKRGKPNRNPFLPKPQRSKWDAYWCTSRFRVFWRFFWRKCGAQFLCYLIIFLLVALLIASFIWQFPNIMAALATDAVKN